MNKREKVKAHIADHLVLYSVVGTVVVAGITYIIVRGVAKQHIDRGIPVVAKRGIPVLADGSVVTQNISKPIFGKSIVLSNVSYISSNRKGPPSWVIRCIETGKVFTSQLSAAEEMNLPASEISRHLNGILDHVRGYTFERICMAA